MFKNHGTRNDTVFEASSVGSSKYLKINEHIKHAGR